MSNSGQQRVRARATESKRDALEDVQGHLLLKTQSRTGVTGTEQKRLARTFKSFSEVSLAHGCPRSYLHVPANLIACRHTQSRPGRNRNPVNLGNRQSSKDLDMRWIVAGWHDENEHACRPCEVIRYEKTEFGDMVRIKFTDSLDLFGDEALISPHMLLPAPNN